MTIRAARYTAAQLKRIAKRQAKNIEPRRARMPIPPSEQLRRFQQGEERWRLDAGLVTPEQYRRYEMAMQRRMAEMNGPGIRRGR
jgi:hypothetical protein